MLINLTNHDINLYKDDILIKTIKTSGEARCKEDKIKIGEIDNIPIYKLIYTKVEGMLEPKEGTYYIVSKIVAEALKNERDDLLIPTDMYRDANNNILGCRGFSKI